MGNESTRQKQLVNGKERIREQHEESKQEPGEDGGEGKDMSGTKWKYHDKDWLKKQYVDNKLTVQDVADKCDVTTSPVSKFNKKFGLNPWELRNQEYTTGTNEKGREDEELEESENEETENEETENEETENEGTENEGTENEETENEGTENEETENEGTEDTGDGFMEQLKEYGSWIIGIGGLIFGIVYAGRVANQKDQEVQEYQQEAEEARTEARQFQQAFQEQQKQQEEQAEETQENDSSRTRATDYFQNHVK